MAKQKVVYRKAKVFYKSPYYDDYKGGGIPPGGFYDLVVKYHGEEKEFLPTQSWPELDGEKGYVLSVDFGGKTTSDEVKCFQRDCEELSDKILRVEVKEYNPSLWRRAADYIKERI